MKKNRPYFPLNPGCLIGILMSWFMNQSPYNWVGNFIPYIKQPTTWRIIPFSMWLITMVSKSRNWGCGPPSKWPFLWLIHGGDPNYLLPGMTLQAGWNEHCSFGQFFFELFPFASKVAQIQVLLVNGKSVCFPCQKTTTSVGRGDFRIFPLFFFCSPKDHWTLKTGVILRT